MLKRIQRLRRDERGMSLVFVGIGFLAFLTATTLAVDVGMFMTARSQAQNAADAGALAGAVGLGFDDFDDRSPSGPAVQSAIQAALNNQVMHGDITITDADVTFPVGPSGASNRVAVTVRRAGGNAVPTLMARMFGINTVDIVATATAEVSPADAMTCVKPFIIPDRWREPSGTLAQPGDTFEMYDNRGNLLASPDVYIGSGTNYTGYNNEDDRGTRLTIRAGSGHNVEPTFYYSLAMGDDTGGADYDWNIANCNHTIMHRGQIVIQEPGNMVGPTIDGVRQLIARDPGARWNVSERKVENSAYGTAQSPRVFPIPLYDPIYYAEGKKNGRFADFKVANWIGFFLEDVSGNEVYGRIIPIGGIASTTMTSDDTGFPIAIRLVQ